MTFTLAIDVTTDHTGPSDGDPSELQPNPPLLTP